MEIIVAEGIGYCFGVRRAVALAEEAAAERGHICTLGPLIHNKAALARMRERVRDVASLDEVEGDAVLIRSHGVAPQVLYQAEQRGLIVIDGTCPSVKKAQRLACVWANAGYQVVIVGDRAHPEVAGICGWADGRAAVVANAAEAAALPALERVAVLAQTTERAANFQAVCAVLRAKARECVCKNTICDHTERVQQITARLAAAVEAMVVVGGRNSSNTAKLAQISRAAGADVYHVEQAAELDCDIVRKYRRIGVTAGASTPQHIIEEVVNRMSELEKNCLDVQDCAAEAGQTTGECACGCGTECENKSEPAALDQTAPAEGAAYDAPVEAAAEEVAACAEAAAETVAETEAVETAVEAADAAAEDMADAIEETVELPDDSVPAAEVSEQEDDSEVDAFTKEYGDMKEIRRGARVKGVVVQVKDDELLVDIGGKSEGVLASSELSADDAKNIRERFHVGDEIDVLILRRENQEGYPVLSKRRVDQDIAWDKLAQLKQDKAIVTGKVTDVVKGGVLVDVGLRGFVPASLVSLGYVEDLSSYLGKELQMKIIECDKHSNKLVLSAKAVLRSASKAQKEKTWAEIEEGQTRHGVVRRLTGFGAFVDIGGVDGLLHVSEMAWYRVNHPSDLLKEGDELDVYILGIDAENEKISLGLKQLIPNPWSLAAEKYPEGSVITAKVMRTTSFGAFLEVEPGVEGLVHISQMANHRVEKTEDVIKPGDVVQVKVLSVDTEAKRMSLSIKAALSADSEEAPADEEPFVYQAAAEEAPADEEQLVYQAAAEEAPAEEGYAEAPAAEPEAE